MADIINLNRVKKAAAKAAAKVQADANAAIKERADAAHVCGRMLTYAERGGRRRRRDASV